MLGATSFGHVGTGGRIGFAHPASGTAVGYTCTDMTADVAVGPDPRWTPWLTALHQALV
ncbi:hypothetical protein [Nocardia brasiliensis]|nr:hypothetical protein [Nocardia brasiliensis]